MPGGDRTGPRGAGPRTGRGAGLCGGYDVPGYMNPVPGYGGRGMRGHFYGGGHGRGHRRMFHATGIPGRMRGWGGWGFYPYPDPYGPDATLPAEEELQYLRQEAEGLEKRLGSITERIRNLEEEAGKDNG